MNKTDTDEKIKAALLEWAGASSFVLRLLRLAYELHGRMDEAHEVYCRLGDEGHLRLREPSDMPRGAAARWFRCVSRKELFLRRIRLAPVFFSMSPELSRFIIEDSLRLLRELQQPSEVFEETSIDAEVEIPKLYRALCQVICDCAAQHNNELWTRVLGACDELRGPENQKACRLVVDEVRRANSK